MTRPKLLVVGLGSMGSMIAKRVGSFPTYQTSVFNRNPSVAEKHAQKYGAIVAPSLPQAVIESDFVISVLTNSNAVHEVLKNLKASQMKSNAVWIDCTSGDPTETISNSMLADSLGMSFIDCAVSGGPRGADAGQLQSMVGGSLEVVEKALAIIKLFSKDIQHLGPIGAGHAVKSINNSLLAANLILSSEAMVALKAYGCDVEKAAKAIAGGSGGSKVMSDRIPNFILNRKFDYGFSMAGLAKDVAIGHSLIESVGLRGGLVPEADRVIQRVMAELGPDADHTEVIRWFERDRS